MHDLIVFWQLLHPHRRSSSMVLGLAIVAGGTIHGCAPAAPPAAVDTKGGTRRQEMADFMKTQPPTGGEAGTPAKKNP